MPTHQAQGVSEIGREAEAAVYELTSGSFHFVVTDAGA